MNKLYLQLEELSSNIPQEDILIIDVSTSNVGWHIEHSLLTINKIIEAIENSNPKNYKWRLKLARILIFTLNKIPRGRGKSPEIVVPKIFNDETLKEHIKITKLRIQNLKNIDSEKYFNHPYFGNLKLKDAVKFLEIHTNHHLEIIKDIIAIHKQQRTANK